MKNSKLTNKNLLEAGADGEDGPMDTDKGICIGLEISLGVAGAEEGFTILHTYIKTIKLFGHQT